MSNIFTCCPRVLNWLMMIWLCAALSLTGCGGGSSSNGGADSDVTYEVRVSIDGALIKKGSSKNKNDDFSMLLPDYLNKLRAREVE